MPNEQRRFPRFTCAGDAELHLLTEEFARPAKVHDLSIEGCLLETEKPMQIQPGVKLEISFKVNNLPFRVKAELRAARSATKFGFQFPLLSPRVRGQLEDLIQELMEDSQKLTRQQHAHAEEMAEEKKDTS